VENLTQIGALGNNPIAREQLLVRWRATVPWVRAAIDDGHVRGVFVIGTPLDVPIESNETVVGVQACRVVVDDVDRPAHCAIIVRTVALPAAQLDDETREAIADALADALLAEVV
jgi:hypothetical protein